MKAERRHELKENSLAHGIEVLPELGRRYGSKILLGLIAILAIVLYFQHRWRTEAESAVRTRQALSTARASVSGIRNLAFIRDPQASAARQAELTTQAEQAIEDVLTNAQDESLQPLRAEALVARGDLNWNLAALHRSSSAASTQPSAKSHGDLLDDAAKAYAEVAESVHASPLAVFSARGGLAAIAETRGQWESAKGQYESIINNPALPQPFKGEAELRLLELKEIQKSPLIGPPATMPTATEAGPPVPETQETEPATQQNPADSKPADETSAQEKPVEEKPAEATPAEAGSPEPAPPKP